MVRKNLIIYAIAIFSAIACEKNPKTTGGVDVDYAFWGEEIIYNDSSKDIKVSITDRNDDVLELNIPAAVKDTLPIPDCSYYICIDVCKTVAVTDGNSQVVLEKGKSKWFNNYEYEEKDYWITIDGKSYLEERKWPIYRFHIDDALLSNAESE